MRIAKLWMIIACLTALTAAWGFARAEAGAALPEEALRSEDTLAAGMLTTVDLSAGERRFAFVPPSGSVYDICVFPTDGAGGASVALWQDGTLLAEAQGSLTVVSWRLSAEARYTIVLRGEGRVRVEAARHALSRCFDEPMPLDASDGRYSKSIARPGDAHWYAVTPEGGAPVVLAGVPSAEGLRLDAQLFDAAGNLLAEATRTTGGACLMDFLPRGGETYRVRVSSPNLGTGLYGLRVARSSGGLPEALTLSESALSLNGRETRALTARVSPDGAADVLFWESSDDSVARVSQSGEVAGRRPGTAVVTAYAAGAVRARCRVEVLRVPAEGVGLLSDRIEMNVGDDVALEWRLFPENASNPRVSFEVSPAGVAEIDDAGVLRAVGEGEATVTVTSVDGGFSDRAVLRVAPALKRYRALLIGEQNYAETVASVRLGSANSVAGLRSMLGGLSYAGARFEVVTRLDVSRDGALAAIQEAFDGATAQDVALFYITCHGRYADGMTCFQMYDGSVLTAAELRQALGRVPGEILLLVDCCGSGGVIGRAGGADDILRGIGEVFGGVTGPSQFEGSRFRVLASASVEQDSYRISFRSDAAESDMATVFARAVCDAGGWSIDRAARSAMRADTNYDDVVTMDELYNYAARRVMWYLGLNGGSYAQSVQVSPEGDVNSVFERS